jgi:hypothetical protein
VFATPSRSEGTTRAVDAAMGAEGSILMSIEERARRARARVVTVRDERAGATTTPRRSQRVRTPVRPRSTAPVPPRSTSPTPTRPVSPPAAPTPVAPAPPVAVTPVRPVPAVPTPAPPVAPSELAEPLEPLAPVVPEVVVPIGSLLEDRDRQLVDTDLLAP